MDRSGAPSVRIEETNAFIWKRADIQTVIASSAILRYTPPSGAWTTAALSRTSCTTQARSTISFNSSVSFVFVGTSLSVNIIKDSSGAPYNVTLDGDVQQYDSYSTTPQCTAEFQASTLAAREHTVTVTHNGNSALGASGRSTLYFVSFDYTPSGNTQPAGSTSPPIGAIVGGVIGAIAAISLCGFVWWFLRRRKSQEEKGKEDAVTYEPYTSAYVVPEHAAQENVDRGSSPHVPTPQHQSRRTKGAEAATNSRYVRTSPWASLTSNNYSRPNAPHDSRSSSDPQNSSQSPADSLQLTSISASQYPATEYSEPGPVQAAMRPLLQPISQRRYVAPPSTVGESILIDDPDYIAPPSYSPPSNHLRHAVQRAPQAKAIYEGVDDSSGYSANWLSPNSTNQGLLGPSTSQGASQTLSQADIDMIARRLADIMRAPSSTTASRYSEISSSDAANPQVQQAVRVLLARTGDGNPQTEPVLPKPPNTGD